MSPRAPEPSTHYSRWARICCAVLCPFAFAACAPEEITIALDSAGTTGPTSPSTSSGPVATTGPTSSDPVASTSTTDVSLDESSSSEATSADSGESGPCVGAPTEEPWWDEQWSRRRPIIIDPTVFQNSGIEPDAAPLSNFPVLLRLEADQLGATWSQRQGADLRFRTTDQSTNIDYDIDDLNSNGEVFIWLKIAKLELDPNAEPTVVWMYYDNPDNALEPPPGNVWPGFISVHHLGSNLKDSAGNNHGESPWEPEICDDSCDPLVGRARRFVPELAHEVILKNEEKYDLGSDPYTPVTSTSFSISLWMSSSSFGDYPWGALVAKGDDTWRIHTNGESVGLGLDCPIFDPQGQYCPPMFEFNQGDQDSAYTLFAPSDQVNVNDSVWHYVVATFAALDLPENYPPEFVPDVQARIYIDGEHIATSAVIEGLVLADSAHPVRLGHNANTGLRWAGNLDELRVMSNVRTPQEIIGDYITVTNPGHVQAGTEEQRPCL